MGISGLCPIRFTSRYTCHDSIHLRYICTVNSINSKYKDASRSSDLTLIAQESELCAGSRVLISACGFNFQFCFPFSRPLDLTHVLMFLFGKLAFYLGLGTHTWIIAVLRSFHAPLWTGNHLDNHSVLDIFHLTGSTPSTLQVPEYKASSAVFSLKFTSKIHLFFSGDHTDACDARWGFESRYNWYELVKSDASYFFLWTASMCGFLYWCTCANPWIRAHWFIFPSGKATNQH